MTIEEMEDILDRLGIEVVSVTGDEIKAHCPAHLERKGRADSNPSWFINSDTGAHNCFSCHFKGSLHSLVEYVNGVDSSTATAWVNSGERNLTKAFEKLLAPTPIVQEQPSFTESVLSAFSSPPDDALASRGITGIAADYFDIKWDNTNQNWITPIRDPYSSKLLGWQEKGYKGRYFKNYPTGVIKSATLFGYGQYSGGDMIVVESPLDTARLASVGILGGVSTYGSAVSNAQVNLIRSADRVVFAMDNDEAGRSASAVLLEFSKTMNFECWFFNYTQTDMKDVGGMSKAEIVWGLENARHSIHGKRAFL